MEVLRNISFLTVKYQNLFIKMQKNAFLKILGPILCQIGPNLGPGNE